MNPYVAALALAGIGLYRRLDHDASNTSAYRFARIPLETGQYVVFMTKEPFGGHKICGWEISVASPACMYAICEWDAIKPKMVERLNAKTVRLIIDDLVHS